ncbi:peptidase inhibitor family I36 protein [Streptomyces alboflavus]|uniref:peptidase inhibitor family I36 protein n=1 Tax=Streptomyces alboflavus TaxID=67267 RepID=UPI00068D6050|nr:peptidase inhibitor family I36 protein [Streptomyces alboflavus]
MIKRNLAAALTAGMLATGGVLLTTAPAQAAACRSGSLCAYVAEQPSSASAYDSRTWTGSPGTVSGSNKNLLQYTKFDQARSLYNNKAGYSALVYAQRNHQGSPFELSDGSGWKTIRGSALWHNVASNKWVR